MRKAKATTKEPIHDLSDASDHRHRLHHGRDGGCMGYLAFDIAAVGATFQACGGGGQPLGAFVLGYTLGQAGSLIPTPSTRWRSVRQTPQACTSTSSWPGIGSATPARRSGRLGASRSIARTAQCTIAFAVTR